MTPAPRVTVAGFHEPHTGQTLVPVRFKGVEKPQQAGEWAGRIYRWRDGGA